jgi:hypothetical protein
MGQNQVDALLQLWRFAHALPAESEEVRRTRFADSFRHLGWKFPTTHNSGGFKHALIGGDLVMKFDRVGLPAADHWGCGREWRIWRRASAYKRRFLARCLAYEDGFLVQERVTNVCTRSSHCPIAKWYAFRFRILDWTVNHGHRKNGDPVFFDYDNLGWDGRQGQTLTSYIQGVR